MSTEPTFARDGGAAARKLSIAVVQGGRSTEAEVSRASAAGVAKALAEAGHSVVRLELDAFVGESLRTGGFDVVFPVTHGALGEDGCLQGLLEVHELPYVGSGVLASALGMHKRVARVLFERAGLPVAKGISLPRGDARAGARRARSEVGARLVVKPSSHGSAIGVTRLEEHASDEEVARALDAVWAIDEFAVVEHFARGREVTCGVLDLGQPEALPPTEIVSPEDPFYTYEARYAPGRSLHVCPARLPAAVLARVQALAVAAHMTLGCRDLSRVDFIVGDDDAGSSPPQAAGSGGARPLGSGVEKDKEAVPLTLLEVNTLPGMTATSLFPEAARVRGLSMPALCDALAARAHARGVPPRVQPRPLPL